ncbi:MAG: hypothetical protein HY709_05695 [Candidatus Latescibacteria bacterium]|nr:hypothetical protein [Candidatus Latescibacterota bacterium]
MRNRWIVMLLLFPVFGCGIFSPDKKGDPPKPGEKPPPTTPELLMDNLEQAMEKRIIEEYEDLLDPNFWFAERSEIDTLDFGWGKDIERRSVKKIFEIFNTFTFEFTLGRQSIELKEEYPATFPDGSLNEDGHPNEDWVVWYGRVQMTMLDETGENGFAVDQNMTFKMRRSNDVAKDPQTGEIMKDANGNPLYRWTIIRWVDDPVLR